MGRSCTGEWSPAPDPPALPIALAWALLAALAVAGAIPRTAHAALAASLDSLPDRIWVEPGSFFVLPLPAPAGSLQIRLFGRTIPVHATGDTSVALVPASYHLQPGMYTLSLQGPGLNRELPVEVQAREFPVQALVVAPSTEQKARPVETPAQNRQAREAADVAAARQQSSEVPLWEGPFLWPVEGRITSEFGLIRTVNGVPNGRHSGLDIAAPEGTPVMAANRGMVVLAANHLTNGNTIILDHGWRLSTSYLHLSEILVREGQEVAKGQLIGRVGSTGFATGPHLHWTANLDGVFIDPRSLVDGALNLPAVPAAP